MKNVEYTKVLVGNPTHLELQGNIRKDQLIYLIMNMPFGCDYSCMKCYRRQDVSIDNLALDVRKAKIKEAKDLGAKVIGIPGEGEPLFHKEIIRELVQYNQSLDLITILYTNGSQLNEKIAQFLFEHNVSLIVSCDSFKPTVYRELTKTGNIQIVKNNLERVRDIYKKSIQRYDNIIETRLGMIAIVTRQNKDEISILKDWCGEEVFFICNYPVKEGNAIKNWEQLVGIEAEYKELIKMADIFTETGHGGLSTPWGDGKCAALYNGITIDANGDVIACPASVKLKVGSIKDVTLSELRRRVKDYIEEHGKPPCIVRHGRRKGQINQI